MRYETQTDGRGLVLELEESDGRIVARAGDRNYEAAILRPEPGVYVMIVGNDVYEARAWLAAPNSMRVELRGLLFAVEIIDRKHRRLSVEHGLEGRQKLLAPMPGKVIRVLLSPGDEVTSGQGVLVVEAMKMQNEIKSPKTGRLVEIRVKPGATVDANQILAVVE